MDVFLLSIISAFLLFAVVLPLVGVAIGLFCYYVLPYVFGGLATMVLLVLVGVKIFFIDQRLAESFKFTTFIGWDSVFTVIPILILLGAGLSALVSFLTLRKYLRV